jgi:hypothetical protein
MEELFLKQVDIYGRLIPSDETLWDVLYDLKTAENRLHFSAYSNEALGAIQHRYNFHKDVFYDLRKYPSWQLIELYELNAELECIWAKQAAIVGLDIYSFLQSKAVDTWFVTVLGNFTNYNMTAIVRSQPAVKASTLSHLQKYLEYQEARDIIELFVKLVNENILINPGMKTLEDDAQKLCSRMAKTLDEDILEANKNDEFRNRKSFGYRCPFCRNFMLMKKGQYKDCRSEQCSSKYNTFRKRINRQLSKQFDSEYVAIANREKANGGKPKLCADCGCKRVVYEPEPSLCKECLCKDFAP